MELITGHKARKWQNRDSNLHLGSLRPGPGGTWTHPLTHTHTQDTPPWGRPSWPKGRDGAGRGQVRAAGRKCQALLLGHRAATTSPLARQGHGGGAAALSSGGSRRSPGR